jgi:hypothetical protein
MSHYTGQAAINNRQGTYIQEILEAIFVNLAAHPLIITPPVLDDRNDPARITLFRDYDGIDLENTLPNTLTLSIFPYKYSSDPEANLTGNSTNASIVFSPYTLGKQGTPQGPLDKATALITFKFHTFGYDTRLNSDPLLISNQVTRFQFNHAEQLLRRWAEVLKLILVSDLQRLPSVNYPARPLLTNSFVRYIDFNSGKWTEGGNLVFHTATLVWEVVYYTKRSLEDFNPVEVIGGQIGEIPDPNNVNNTVPVCYNLTQDRYFNCVTSETIPRTDLVDPATGTYYASLATSVIHVVDMINSQRSDFVTIGAQP